LLPEFLANGLTFGREEDLSFELDGSSAGAVVVK
jgi:hypothetical protein